jgi:general stress protein YciG
MAQPQTMNSKSNINQSAPAGATSAGNATPVPAPKKGGRGFASMDAAKQREIASKGGKAAHQLGVAHEFTSEEARSAGRKGGEAVSQDTRHMAEIGARGGQKRGLKKKQALVNANSLEGKSSLDPDANLSDEAPNKDI